MRTAVSTLTVSLSLLLGVGTAGLTVVDAGPASAAHGVAAPVAAPAKPKPGLAPPTVGALRPKSGPVAGGTKVTVKGYGFTKATKVLFGTKRGTKVKIKSDRKLTVVAPAHKVGRVDVRVVRAGAKSKVSKGDRFTYKAASAVVAPVVASVSPTSGSTAGGTAVTITGSGLGGATVVSFGGAAASSVSVVSSSEVTAVSPAHLAGAVDVQVTTPAGTSAASAGDRFTYIAPTPPPSTSAPTVTGIAPTTGSTDGGTTVTVTGTDLTGATAVTFGGTPASAVTVASSTQLTAVSPAHDAGAVDVQVVTGGGTSATSTADQFTYDASVPAAPTVSSISPSTGPVAGGTFVTITGTHLSGVTAVTFGGTPGVFPLVVSDTQLFVATPAHDAGVVDVQVTGPGGTTTVTNGFAYGDAPTVTAISPATGLVTGGTVVTVTGTGFDLGTPTVTFGALPGTAVTVVSPTELTVTSPASLPATVDVVVSTSAGSSATSSADQFTYATALPPVVAVVLPITGGTPGGTSVTLTGTGFTGATSVTFGGVPGTDLQVLGDTSLTVVTPTHAAGAVDVQVTTPAGTSTLIGAYVYSGCGPLPGLVSQVITPSC